MSGTVFGWCSPSFYGPAPPEQHKACRVQFTTYGKTWTCACACHQPDETRGDDTTDETGHGDQGEPGQAPDEEPVPA